MAEQPEQLIQHIRRLVSATAPSAAADADLLDRFIRHRDEASFAALVQRHGAMVLGVCRRILGNVHDAEDAFQAAFLVLARKADSVNPRDALTAWLYGVARRVALKARATRTRQRRRLCAASSPSADPHASPLDDLSARELLALFDEELQRLPRTYRLPLILCCIEGRTQEEAARQLGWTAGSVKGRLERGRARLHNRLLRRGLTLSAALMAVEATRACLFAALAEMTVSASLRFLAGRGSSGAVCLLADAVLRGMAWGRATVWAALVSVLLVAVGTGTLAFSTKPAESEQPNGPPSPQAQQPEPRRDQHGDPLPPHAIARLGTLRFRGIRGCLAFSPDGKLLASVAGRAREHLVIWDTATGQKIRQIAGTDTLMRLAFSPDGRRLAISDNANHCRVVDPNTGKLWFTVPGMYGTFSADSKILVTGEHSGLAGQVLAWDAATGKGILEGFPARVQELAVIGDGRTVVLIEQGEPVVKVVNLTTGKLIRSFRLAWFGSPRLSLTADGKTLASTDFNDVRLWDMATGKMVRVWNCRSLSGAAVFSPDGKHLAWTSQDEKGGSHRLWVVERDGGKPRAVGAPVHNFETPCFSPDGKRLAVITDASVLSVRNVTDGKEVPSFDAPSRPVIDLTFGVDESQVVSSSGDEVFVWQARTGKLLRRSPLLSPGHEYLAPLLSGASVLTGERTSNPSQGRFWLRDIPTGENILRFEGRPAGGPPPAVAAPGGRFVAVRGSADEICVLDVSQRRCIYRFDPEGAAFGLKLSANGDVLVGYRRQDTAFEMYVHRQTINETLTFRVSPKSDSIQNCLKNYSCVSPDGRWLLLPGEPGRLRRWDLTTGKEASALTEALGTVSELVWSPDGRFVAAQGSASPANAIDPPAPPDVRVWDVRAGIRLPHLTVPNRQGVIHTLFSHDGRTMLTTDSQGVIHLWEIATGKERGRLLGHLSYEISSWVLRADDRMLVSGGYDSQSFVWDLTGRMPDGQWRATSNSLEQRRASWETLASNDATAAYRALWQLAADPVGTVAFLHERLHPSARPDPKQVASWLADLDSPEFATREHAAEELEKRGETVASELRKTLTHKPSLEVRRRIEALLEKLQGTPQGRQLQAVRALEVLEQIGTTEARGLLRKIAEGTPDTRLTDQARETIHRLEKSKSP